MSTAQPPAPPAGKPQGSKKGLIIGIVLVVGFFMLAGTAVLAYFGWRYYTAYQAAKAAQAAPPIEMPDMPSVPGEIPTEPVPEMTPDVPAPEIPTEAPPEMTSEPTAEPAATEAPAATKPPAPKKTKTPKPAATAEPEETPEPKKVAKAQVYDVSHVHGGLKKKVCSGTIELSATGIKYTGTTSEDDNVHQAEYTFSQVKKVEMKDAKNVEVATTDKKWTFRGDGLIVAKITTHLNTHSSEFAGR